MNRMNNQLNEIDALQKQINKMRPLDSHTLKTLRNYYRVGLTYASNALEGNTLTESETKVVLEDGLTIGGKSLVEHYEALGHAEAFDYIHEILEEKIITDEMIKRLHTLFYYRIDREQAGKYRKVKVFISGTKYIPPAPEEVEIRMNNFLAKANESRSKYHPVEFAAMLHQELVEIHPFIDGNGRTARLLMNLALLQAGYVVVIIPPIRRADYISSIVNAQVPPKSKEPFFKLIQEMLIESQKDYLRMLRT